MELKILEILRNIKIIDNKPIFNKEYQLEKENLDIAINELEKMILLKENLIDIKTKINHIKEKLGIGV